MDVLPLVAEERCFALKGGTAINLFVRDLPRLSVDIDLTYVPVQDRATSLGALGKALERMALSIERQAKNIRCALRWIDNIRVICSMCRCCWNMKESATSYSRSFSCIC